MDIVLRPWRHYADFAGRSRRTEFLLFIILFYVALLAWIVVGALLLGVTAGITGHDASESLFFGVIYLPMIVFLIASIIPSLALIVRRLHDQDKSGWFMLLTFVPFIGWLFWLVIAFWSGTDGENAYGYDPREGDVREPDDLARVFS